MNKATRQFQEIMIETPASGWSEALFRAQFKEGANPNELLRPGQPHGDSLNPLRCLLQQKEVDHGEMCAMVSCFLEYGAEFEKINSSSVWHENLPKTDESFPALHYAVLREYIDAAKLLVKNGANVNVVEKYGKSPLHLAIYCENMEMIDVLLEKGADINHANGHGAIPLNYAINGGSKEIMLKIINHPDLKPSKENKGLTDTGKNILHILASSYTDFLIKDNAFKEELVRMLVKKGFDIHKRDDMGRTPLITAASVNMEQSLKVWLECGSNLEAEDEEGKNALHWVLLNSQVVKLRSLLESGIDLAPLLVKPFPEKVESKTVSGLEYWRNFTRGEVKELYHVWSDKKSLEHLIPSQVAPLESKKLRI